LLLAFVELTSERSRRLPRPAPCLYTVSLLQVLDPVPLVLGLAVHVYEDAVAISSIRGPLPLVYVAVGMSDAAPALGLPSVPQSFVPGAIEPELDAQSFSISRAFVPLALVEATLPDILELIYVNQAIAIKGEVRGPWGVPETLSILVWEREGLF
jgi:hypothetical protein